MKKTAMMMAVLVMAVVTVEAQFVEPPTVAPVVVTPDPVIMPVVKAEPAVVAKPTTAPAKTSRFSVGAYGVYTFGGDIETPSLGAGAKVGWGFSKSAQISLGVNSWSDKDKAGIIQMDVMSFEATLLYLPEVLKDFYLGFGTSISEIDMKANLPGINIEVEDAIGIHGLIGYEKNISRNFGLFAEVQYHDANTTARIYSDCGDEEVVGGGIDRFVVIAGVKFKI